MFPLITFPYITRVLGADNLGLANFAISVVDYAVLFSTLGLTYVGLRFIPQCNDDVGRRNYVFNSLVTLHFLLSGVVLIVYTACVFLIPQLYNQKILYLVGISKIVVNVFLVEWLFQGMQDFRYITLRALVLRTLYVVAIFVFVRQKDDYDLYFYITIAQVVLNAIINWHYSHRYVSFRLSFRGIKEFLFPVLSMGINRILLSFYTTFNIIYLGIKCDDDNVGFFVTATRLYGILLSFLGAFDGAFVPYLNSLFGKGDMDKFKHYVGYSFSIVILLSLPLTVGCIILAPEIIGLIAGPGYEKAILPFRIVMFQILFVSIAQILENQILLSLKKFKEVLICTSISTALSVFILFAFVPKYAEVASAMAVTIPHFIEVGLLYFFATNSIDIRFPVKAFLQNIITCIPIVFFCISVRLLSLNSFLTLLIAGSISLVYFLIVQLFVLKNEFLITQFRTYFPAIWHIEPER